MGKQVALEVTSDRGSEVQTRGRVDPLLPQINTATGTPSLGQPFPTTLKCPPAAFPRNLNPKPQPRKADQLLSKVNKATKVPCSLLEQSTNHHCSARAVRISTRTTSGGTDPLKMSNDKDKDCKACRQLPGLPCHKESPGVLPWRFPLNPGTSSIRMGSSCGNSSKAQPRGPAGTRADSLFPQSNKAAFLGARSKSLHERGAIR